MSAARRVGVRVRKAIALDAKFGPALRHLSDLTMAAGQTEEAVRLYRDWRACPGNRAIKSRSRSSADRVSNASKCSDIKDSKLRPKDPEK